jgi:hypothetical protein
MPADIAEQASLASPEAPIVEQAQPDSSSEETAQPAQTKLKFSVGDVMRKAGVPDAVRKAIAAKPKEEEQPPPEKPKAQDTHGEDDRLNEGEDGEESDSQPAPKSEEEEEEQPKGRLTLEKLAKVAEQRLRRIDKLTARVKRAEEENEQFASQYEQLKTSVEESPPVVVAASASDPLASVSSVTQLNQVYSEAKIMRDWARKNPDGMVLNEGKENERVVSREEMTDHLSLAEDMLNEHLPRKRAQLQAGQQFDSVARQIYPNLFDRENPDYQAARNVLGRLPGLALLPERNIVIGDYLVGLNMRLAKAKKNGHQPAPEHNDLDERIIAPKPPIAVDTPNPPERREMPARKKVEEATAQVAKSGGDQRAVAQAIKAIWENRRKSSNQREPVNV